MLIDSTIFIDYLRGKEEAKTFLNSPPESLTTSIIVVMEIIAGLYEKEEMEDFLLLVQELNIEIIHLSNSISQTAFLLFKNFYRRGLGIADSLIAATAIEKKDKIATHNAKHFSSIKEVSLTTPYKYF